MGDPGGQAYGGGILTPTPLDELARRTGNELGISDYVPIAQQTVDAFADVTGDHQWIHTDPARAEGSPFGGTIAHGYLTLGRPLHTRKVAGWKPAATPDESLAEDDV